MPSIKFDDFYHNYTKSPERKAAVEQFEEQLKASVLLSELREKEKIIHKRNLQSLPEHHSQLLQGLRVAQ